MNAGHGRRLAGLGYRRRRATGGPGWSRAGAAAAPRSAATAGAPATAAAAALTVTLGLAAASWVAAAWLMTGMDMGPATRLGSFGFFITVWVVMMAAMTLPGAARPSSEGFVLMVGRGRCPCSSRPTSLSGQSWALRSTRCTGRTERSQPAGCDRGGCVRADADQAPLPPALPRARQLWTWVRALPRGLEHRTDGGDGVTGRDERHVDVGGRGRRDRPEAAARESRDRRAFGAGDPRTRSPDRDRALIGTRTHATDVDVRPRQSRGSAGSVVTTTKERVND